MLFPNVSLDLVLARLRTKVAVMAGYDHIWECLAVCGHSRTVHDPCDIRSAMADINPNSTFLFILECLHSILSYIKKSREHRAKCIA
jgi:hypothetical protein